MENKEFRRQSTPNVHISQAVLVIGSSTSISGTDPKAVWDTLINTSTWSQWNSFCPRVTIREQPTAVDSNNASAVTPLSPVLQLGTRMTFHVDMDSSTPSYSAKKRNGSDDTGDQIKRKLRPTSFVVTVFEPPDPSSKEPGRIAWAADPTGPGGFPPWLHAAERVHEIYKAEEEEGAETEQDGRTPCERTARMTTKVRNWELQAGWLAYVVRWLFGQVLQRKFEIWVEDLKTFMEEQAEVEGPA
ncbi:hypothetical protein Egran_07032 [Elaphomyces granulatus]|uniref:Coenzyme Q-binding protein COQ10 START domain-containing protein n=1 Tax=Elaphomyces granulatus TaxID=519963 RepID=A0A232LM13_9EURO|nr:hypothetical protein Egran_07032 [Elaphomyces granulatus]